MGGGPILTEIPMEISPAWEVAGAPITTKASSANKNNPDITIPLDRRIIFGSKGLHASGR